MTFRLEDEELNLSEAWRNAARRTYRRARKAHPGTLGRIVAREAVDQLLTISSRGRPR
jgi:hypothetical protein